MNILLVRTGGLGDCILTLPVALKIRRLYPLCSLDVLGNATMLSVASLTTVFDALFSVDSCDFHRLFSSRATSDALRVFFSRYDLVYLFSANNGVLVRYAILENGARECRYLDPRPPTGYNRHIAQHLLSILGDDVVTASLPDIPAMAVSGPKTAKRSGLAIQPGSGGWKKNWSPDRFVRLAKEVSAPVTFIFGPAEIERGMTGKLRMAEFACETPDTIGDLSKILSSAVLYLGNDSGVSHLAAFCRTPSVVLYGPTNPEVWRPLGKAVEVVRSPDGTMDGIRFDDVMDAVIRGMGESR